MRLEVVAPTTEAPIELREPSLAGKGGFGLHIVDRLAQAWGVRLGNSTVVWATLTI